LKIAQVAPPWLSLPPRKHGGTELVVSLLTEELCKAGHDLTLFAPGESSTSATLVATPKSAAGVSRMSSPSFERMQIRELARVADHFDVIHVHTVEQLRAAGTLPVPVVMTLHDPPSPALRSIAPHVHMVPPSQSYAQNACSLDLMQPIHHGIDVDRYPVRGERDDFLLFIGRAVPEKGLHRAIAAARDARTRLVAVVVRSGLAREERYLADVVKPILTPDVTLLDQVDFSRKVELMGSAGGLLFPIAWNEPFGLVVVEAMACGTPVIATSCAAVPELVLSGVTGFVAPQHAYKRLVEEVVRNGKLRAIDQWACRRHVERRFNSRLMALRYVVAYERVIAHGRRRSP
jgi:glycosyltransferase involved in cell wall biosynthesis